MDYRATLQQPPGLRSQAGVDHVCNHVLTAIPLYQRLRQPARRLAAQHAQLVTVAPNDPFPKRTDDRHQLLSVVSGAVAVLHSSSGAQGRASSKSSMAASVPGSPRPQAPSGLGAAGSSCGEGASAAAASRPHSPRNAASRLVSSVGALGPALGSSRESDAPHGGHARTSSGGDGGCTPTGASPAASDRAHRLSTASGAADGDGGARAALAPMPAKRAFVPGLKLAALIAARHSGSDEPSSPSTGSGSWGVLRSTVNARSRFLMVSRDAAAASTGIVAAALHCIDQGLVTRNDHEALAAAGFIMAAAGPGDSFSGDQLDCAHIASAHAGCDSAFVNDLPLMCSAISVLDGDEAELISLCAAVYAQVLVLHVACIRAERVQACCRLPFLRYAPLAALHEMAGHLQEATFQPGELLLQQDTEVKYMHFLLEGEVEVHVRALPAEAGSSLGVQHSRSEATARKKVMCVRGPGAVLGDDALREKHMPVSVVALTPVTTLRIAPLKLMVAADKLTLRLLTQLRLQHGPEAVAQAALITDAVAAVQDQHRSLMLDLVYRHGAAPHVLERAGTSSSEAPTPEKPGWKSSQRVITAATSAAEAAASSGSSTRRAAGAAAGGGWVGRQDTHEGRCVQLAAWSPAIDARFVRSADAACSRSPSPTHGAAAGRAGSKRGVSPVPHAAAAAGAGGVPSAVTLPEEDALQLPSLVAERAAAVQLPTSYTELYEDCCCAKLTIQPMPGQWTAQESVTLAMLDDVHAKWASIGHDDDLIIMRWSAWETFVLCPLVPGSSGRDYHMACLVDSLLQLLAAFEGVASKSGAAAAKLACGVAVGSVFAQHDGGVHQLHGSCYAAASALCDQALASQPGSSSAIFLSDGAARLMDGMHIASCVAGAHRLALPNEQLLEQRLPSSAGEAGAPGTAGTTAAASMLASWNKVQQAAGGGGEAAGKLHKHRKLRSSVVARRNVRKQLEAIEQQLEDDHAAGIGIMSIDNGAQITQPPAPTKPPALAQDVPRVSPRRPNLTVSVHDPATASPRSSAHGGASPAAGHRTTHKSVAWAEAGEAAAAASTLSGISPCPGSPSQRLSSLAAARTPIHQQAHTPAARSHPFSPAAPRQAHAPCSPVKAAAARLSTQERVRREVEQLRHGDHAAAGTSAASSSSSPAAYSTGPDSSRWPPHGRSPWGDAAHRRSAGAPARCTEGGAATAASTPATAHHSRVSFWATTPHHASGTHASLGSFVSAFGDAEWARHLHHGSRHSAHSVHGMHSAHSVHSAHSAHSVHGMHSAHSVHSMHTAHSLHDMHSAHSMHSLADSNMGDAPVEDAAAWKLQVLGVSRSLGSWQAAQAFVWQLPEDTSHVDLSASGLRDLPSLGHLPHLHTLSASFNQLASLTAVDGPGPDDLPESLQCLSVPHNKLSQLPPDLPSWLPALQELDCSYNQLQELPAAIGSLVSLHTLSCSHNQLRHLPSSCSQLQQLTALHAAGNDLRGLPEGLACLRGLRVLTVSGNPRLRQLPADLTALWRLQQLGCSDCGLTQLPQGLFVQLAHLRVVDVSANALSDSALARAASGWQAAVASSSQRWPGGSSTGSSSDSGYGSTTSGGGGGEPQLMPQLQSLNLASNQLQALPPWLPASLQQLHAGHNRLQQLPDWLPTRLTGLQALALEHNVIGGLPDQLTRLAGLQQLSLEVNPVTCQGPAFRSLSLQEGSCWAVDWLVARKQGYSSAVTMRAAQAAREAMTPRALREKAQSLPSTPRDQQATPRQEELWGPEPPGQEP